MDSIMILITISIIFISIMGGITYIANNYSLNKIKAKTVGDGQHGVAHFITKGEIKSTYEHVPYEVLKWRKGQDLPKKQGLIVGCKNHKNSAIGLVDTGDIHCLIIGASGVGKTAFFLYPNLEYACATGMSFIT